MRPQEHNFTPSNDVFFRVISGRRYYSTDLGRWMNRDPIGEDGGVNLYLAVENAMTNHMDALGQFTVSGPEYKPMTRLDFVFSKKALMSAGIEPSVL